MLVICKKQVFSVRVLLINKVLGRKVHGGLLIFTVHCLRIPSHLLIFAVHSEPNPLQIFEDARQRASDRRHSMLNKCGVVLVLFRRNE